jgi:hypothetical protein
MGGADYYYLHSEVLSKKIYISERMTYYYLHYEM